MKYLPIIILFLLPTTLLAQGAPCTNEIQLFYDDAGNRIQRKEVCNGGGNPTRLAAPEIKELVVFPNPSSGVFELKLPSGLENTRLVLYDASGKIVMQQTLQTNHHSLDLSNKPTGIYLLKILAIGYEDGKTLVKE